MRYETIIKNTRLWFEIDDNLIKDKSQNEINQMLNYLDRKLGEQMIKNNTYDISIRQSFKG